MPFDSAVLRGWQSTRVSVHVKARAEAGGKGFSLFGNVGPVLREAKSVIPLGFESLDMPVPAGSLIVQLQPIDIPKNRSALHLALALATYSRFILSEATRSERFDCEHTETEEFSEESAEAILAWARSLRRLVDKQFFCFGEVNIKGQVARVDGALSMLDQSRPGDIIIVPEDNLHEAQFWAKTCPHAAMVEIYAVADLSQAWSVVLGEKIVKQVRQRPLPKFRAFAHSPQIDFKDIVGQDNAKRALEISAAGGHHCLLYGPKGEGKSLLAKALPGILPPLDPEVNMSEILDVNRIWSAKGALRDGELVLYRPFREVSPGASEVAILGGGAGDPQPGEISLAHRGVLLMDEFPQFSRGLLEKLRGPLQDKSITVSRANGSFTFPAAFILVAAMNPCQCSYYGEFLCRTCGKVVLHDELVCRCGEARFEHRCKCGGAARRKFERLLSGPIEDRLHIKVRVYSSRFSAQLTSRSRVLSTSTIRHRVMNARRMQADRFSDHGLSLNSEVQTPNVIVGLFRPTKGAKKLVSKLPEVLPYAVSMRTKVQTLLVARTIADLEGCRNLLAKHVAEAALRYSRPLSASIEERKVLPISIQGLLKDARISEP